MTNYININGVDFEMKNTDIEHFNQYTEYADAYYCKKTLEQCYAKPSKIKQAIYSDWFNWYSEMNLDNCTIGFNATHFRIVSFNVFQFSLGVALWRDNMPFAILRITRAHNIAYIVQ